MGQSGESRLCAGREEICPVKIAPLNIVAATSVDHIDSLGSVSMIQAQPKLAICDSSVCATGEDATPTKTDNRKRVNGQMFPTIDSNSIAAWNHLPAVGYKNCISCRSSQAMRKPSF